MEPEEKKMLRDTMELVEENNKMLHHIRRSQKLAAFMRAIYWVVIIIIGVGSYYFIQPYVDQVQKIMKESGATIDKFKSILPK